MIILLIEYTDGEAKVNKFETLDQVLDHIREKLIVADDYADKISIDMTNA